MTGNEVTVLVGVAGILASLYFSLVFYRAGKRGAKDEIQGLLDEIHGLRAVLSNVFDEMDERFPSKAQLRSLLTAAGSEPAAAAEVASQVDAESSKTAVDVLVRASLGPLLNERGQVPLPRLMRAVGQAIGPSRLSEVFDSLVRLRADGVVDWEGDAAALPGVPYLAVGQSFSSPRHVEDRGS